MAYKMPLRGGIHRISSFRGVIVLDEDGEIIMALGPSKTAIKVTVYEPALREVLVQSSGTVNRGAASGVYTMGSHK